MQYSSVSLHLSVFFFILILSALLAPSSSNPFVYLYSALLQVVLVLFIPLLVLRTTKRNVAETNPLKSVPPKTWGAVLLCGISAIPLLEEINYQQFSMLKLSNENQAKIIDLLSATSSTQFLIIVISMAVLPAVCEETFFRGFLFSGFNGNHHPWIGVIFTALLFGLFHLAPVSFLPASLAGLLLGFLRARTGSLLPPMAVHFLINGWSILLVNSPLGKLVPGGIHIEPVSLPFLLGSSILFLWGISKLETKTIH
jgi:membrane protease YdiL (CAAX protease family)